MRSPQKTMALWAFFIVGAVLLYMNFEKQMQASIKDFNYSKFRVALEANEIENLVVQMEGNNIGQVNGKVKEEYASKYQGGTRFSFPVPLDGFSQLVEGKGVEIEYAKAGGGLLTQIFLNWLPLKLKPSTPPR